MAKQSWFHTTFFSFLKLYLWAHFSCQCQWGYRVYCRIRNVYCCFTKAGVKCTNLKFLSCKYIWPLGSCENCLELKILIFPSHFAKLQSEALSLLLTHWSQLQDSVTVGGELMGGQSGHPGELWEFCDCNRYCSPDGGCARAHLLTLWVSRNSRHQRVMPSGIAPPQTLFVHWFQNNRRQEAFAWQDPGNAQLATLQPSFRSVYSWEGVGSGMLSVLPQKCTCKSGRGRGLAIYFSLIWSEICAFWIEPFLSPNELRVWPQCSDPQITLCPKFPGCRMSQAILCA